MDRFEIGVIGAGPAGSTAARLLAEWGFSVVLWHAPGSRPALAETLPPSIDRVFRLTGIPQPHFYRTKGNTVRWGNPGPGGSPVPAVYPEGAGYQVNRAEFDDFLLGLTKRAGVRIISGRYDGAQPSHFLLDCSGRNGVLARRYAIRKYVEGLSMMAVDALWSNPRGWPQLDDSHTFIEAYRDGWAWSVPLSATRRHVTFMVDPRTTRLTRGAGLAALYRGELAKTHILRDLLAASGMDTQPAACDASLYQASSYYGSNWMLVGDAGSFVDPLSSFGVRKAISSAWLAAVVVNTCLNQPSMRSAALAYFEQRERQTWRDQLRQSAALYREGAVAWPHPFWTSRADLQQNSAFYEQAEVARALESIRANPGLRVRRSPQAQFVWQPAVQGRQIVYERGLSAPGLPDGLRFVSGVDLPALVEIAEAHRGVPEIAEAYNRTCPQVAMPNLLGALSLLVAKRVLEDAAFAS